MEREGEHPTAIAGATLAEEPVRRRGRGSTLLGAGTALVYPTLIAAVSDAASPSERAQVVGVYRFWRDVGFVLGALLAGLAADALGSGSAITLVALLTAASGVWVALSGWSRAQPRQRATALGTG